MGYPVSPNVNPSDHYLDVIDQHNKKAEAAGRSRLSSASSNVTDSGFKHLQTLGDMWTTRQQSTDGGTSINSLPASCSQDFTARKPANFFVQLLFFMHRAFVLQVSSLCCEYAVARSYPLCMFDSFLLQRWSQHQSPKCGISEDALDYSYFSTFLIL